MTSAETLGLAPLIGDLERVEARLLASVRHEDRFLAEVGAHLITAGGKRIRPTLTLCSAYAASDPSAPAHDDVITGAAACELVHLGSLHHDDVIDEAETRRGVPSVNARWSNIVAILSGDFLLARASSLAASLGAEVAALLADTIGELCRGQVLELQHLYDVTRSEEDYTSAIEGKTASLFATSSRVGGMVSRVDEPTLDALTRYGHHLGLCFQIIDDVLDLTADEETLGKPAGQDLLEGIYTLPVISALAEDASLAQHLGQPLDHERCDEVRRRVAETGAVESTLAIARDHATKANEALAGAHGLDDVVTDRLRSLVDGLVDRDR
ncbi:MAG TPA: polyprenyl synthetase family protein [Acidimicrobiia bacterium]|nr:polyprenyl synthetase family protein [Acidimicrobiia bacterium]